jgi:hypothetical protein
MILRTAVLITTLGLVSGCLGKTFSWKEEVLLHDGKVIVIERSVRTGKVPVEIGQPPGESHQRITLRTVQHGSVSWDGGKALRPMILEIHGGNLYLVALGRTALDYQAYGCPRPPYLFFRYNGEQWERVAYEDFPWQIRQRNLLSGATSRSRALVEHGYVTVDQVRQSQSAISRYYRELREDMPNPCADWGNPMQYKPPTKKK